MIKLIACDMDGTLLNENGKLDEDFYEVFEKLMKRDIKFVVASGRQYYQLLKNFERVGDKLYYIAENGTLVRYKDEELHFDTLSEEDVAEIVEFGQTIEGINMVICGKKNAYAKATDKAVVDEIHKYYDRYKIVDSFEDIDDEIMKIAVYNESGVEESCYKPFMERFGARLQVIVSGNVWLDLYNIGASKGFAIKLLQEKYNIKKEETMVFGDYYNDLDMFKMAYYSYAMENAPEGVKKEARFIARSNRDSGVIKAIREVVLKEPV